ncbi:MAG TPA: peptidylprolyl isomerase [Bryobacteraceae bacterium]|jgi:parvulin-like peptidyl-prolyl isomerase
MYRRFALLIAAAIPLACAADIKVVEEIAAKVNGDIITRGELEQRRRDIEQFFKQQGMTGAKLTDAVKQQEGDSLRDQIDQLLLVQRAKDLSISVDPEVNRYLADLQVQSKITDTDKFHEWIREQTGMPFEDFRDQKRKEFLARRVVGQEVGSRIAIPEADQQKYYDEHKAEFVRKEQVFLSQILISLEGKSADQQAAAEKKAKDLVARARKGEKFTDLARENSDDPETAKDGGYLGPFQKGQLRPEIENIVFKEKKGFVTDPIRSTSPASLLILRVDERYEAGQASFEEVRNDILDRMMEPKMTPRVREYLTHLRESAFLEIKDGYVDSGAAPGKDTRWHEVAELKPQTITKEEVAARKRKKFLGIIPHGKSAPKTDSAAPAGSTPPPAPAAAPAPAGSTPEPAATPIKK